MSGLEILNRVLHIIQIIGIVLPHAQVDNSIKDVLEEAPGRLKRINVNVEDVDLLPDIKTLLFLSASEGFESIFHHLLFTQEELINRATRRSVLTSPSSLAQLKQVARQLFESEENIKVLGMIAKLDIHQRSSSKGVYHGLFRVLKELFALPNGLKQAQLLFCHFSQIHCLKSKSLVLRKQCRRERWDENINQGEKIAAEIVFFEGNCTIQQDFLKAARYLNAALSAGNSEANYYLGMLYRTGRGVQICNRTALRFFEKGARAKDPKAIAELGECYIFGVGVEVNDPLAVAYTKMASDAEDPKAIYWRALQKMYGNSTDRNLTTTRNLAEKAVKKGYQNAKLILAKCYHLGLGVERDATKTIDLWTEVVDAGGITCVGELGPIYEHGLGVDVDFRKAAE